MTVAALRCGFSATMCLDYPGPMHSLETGSGQIADELRTNR